jgi:hypothetical protein
MDLLPYREFARLRLNQFPSGGNEVCEDDGTEWMEGLWITEYLGPNACVIARSRETPKESGAMKVDFQYAPTETADKMLSTIRLPLKPRMTPQDVESLVGKSDRSYSYDEERKSFDFTVGSKEKYLVRCFFFAANGLISVHVFRKDILELIAKRNAEMEADIEGD